MQDTETRTDLQRLIDWFAGVAPRYRRLQNRALGLCFTSGMLCRVQFGWNRGV